MNILISNSWAMLLPSAGEITIWIAMGILVWRIMKA